MAMYCDVALPVPLDRTFTYAVNGAAAGGNGSPAADSGLGLETAAASPPVVGGRVIVPFGGQRLMGVVVRVHDEAPPAGVEVKPVQQVMDSSALLPEELMRLARWIAEYYCAPLGEVLRGMMPLAAEVRRQFCYRIADAGRRVLYEGAERGASRRSRLTPEEQNREYAVLNYLEDGHAAKAAALRSATGARKALLDGMVRKRWLVREAMAEERDARRVEKIAVLEDRDQGTGTRDQEGKSSGEGVRLPKLNENQLRVMAELAACGGRMRVSDLRGLPVPASTLGTLVRRGLVRIEEAAEEFRLGGVAAPGKKLAHEHALNEGQMEALAEIVAAMAMGQGGVFPQPAEPAGGFRPMLLYGVTGSGKTAVYVAAMQRALAAGRSAILLVPEIGLTPAMAGQMFAAFGREVALLHSALTPDERAEQWHRIRRGEARVVVGTRSAVFAPVADLGLILVDEEHDSSYKQEETPRYNGRDVAVMRAKLNEAVVVLGSATPSLESWSNAERGRYRRVEMRERVAGRPLPEVELVDMRAEFLETRREEIFSRRLVEEVDATLARGEQAIVLLNRRGYSATVLCRSCGEKIECENCAIAMTYHRQVASGTEAANRSSARLECHYCGFRRPVPKVCPKCGSEHLFYLGVGSEQGEERLQAIFPNARIGRMDRDTVRGRGDMERLLARLHSGEINLLVGTQMIAKGHDIHGVTLVGVVGADLALGLPDFRAAERVFQLLTQVSGRAGRGELSGRVLVQTYHPEHYAIRFAQRHDYPGFAAREMEYRRWMHYPPMTALGNVIVQGESLEEASGWAAVVGRWFAAAQPEKVRVLGPAAAPIARLKRIYRLHFVLKAERRDALGRALKAMLAHAEAEGVPRRSLIVDVDALNLM